MNGRPTAWARRTNRLTRSNHCHGSNSGPSLQTSASSSAFTVTGGPWLMKRADASVRSDSPGSLVAGSVAVALSWPNSSSASSGAVSPVAARNRSTGFKEVNSAPSIP